MDDKPLRKDSALKREKILTAARVLFGRKGVDVGLNEIAAHAGVGVGTVYRHFPDRDAILDVLFEQRLEEVAALAEAALTAPDSWEALTGFLDGWIRLHIEDPSLTRVFTDPGVGAARLDASRDRIAPLTEALADRARRDGHTRADFRGSDVFFIQLALIGLVDQSRAHTPDIYRRYLAMILEGVTAHPDPRAPLPVPALDVEATHRIAVDEGEG